MFWRETTVAFEKDFLCGWRRDFGANSFDAVGAAFVTTVADEVEVVVAVAAAARVLGPSRPAPAELRSRRNSGSVPWIGSVPVAEP